MLKRYSIYILIIIASVIFTKPSFSQVKNDDIWEKIEKIKLDKLTKRLDLDESTTPVFQDKYTAFSKTIRELNMERVKYFKLMAENLQSGNGLDTLVQNVLNIEDEINQQRTDFANELKQILTPKQIATMIIFERKFNIQLRKLIQEYNKKKNKPENN